MKTEQGEHMQPLYARDIMVTRVMTLHPEQDIHAAIDMLVGQQISGAPVVDKVGRLVGILSEKDCLNLLTHAAVEGLGGGKVSDFMTTVVSTVEPSVDIMSLATTFLARPIRRLPVVHDGRLVGVVSRHDVLRGIQRMRREAGKPAYPDYRKPGSPYVSPRAAKES